MYIFYCICYVTYDFACLLVVAALSVIAGVGVVLCAGRPLYNITYTIAEYTYTMCNPHNQHYQRQLQ
jgi:hypothetical protein